MLNAIDCICPIEQIGVEQVWSSEDPDTARRYRDEDGEQMQAFLEGNRRINFGSYHSPDQERFCAFAKHVHVRERIIESAQVALEDAKAKSPIDEALEAARRNCANGPTFKVNDVWNDFWSDAHTAKEDQKMKKKQRTDMQSNALLVKCLMLSSVAITAELQNTAPALSSSVERLYNGTLRVNLSEELQKFAIVKRGRLSA